MRKIDFGKKNEIIAKNYLIGKGYKILEMNYKNKIGEIDIIAKDDNYIVFVEVKGRFSRMFGDPAEAVNEEKQYKIRSVASIYLMQKRKTEANCRFDVIAVLGDGEPNIRHIIDAF